MTLLCKHCGARAHRPWLRWRYAEGTGRCLKCGNFFDDAVEERVRQAVAGPGFPARRARQAWPTRIIGMVGILFGGFRIIGALFGRDVGNAAFEGLVAGYCGFYLLRRSGEVAEDDLRKEHQSRTDLTPFQLSGAK